LVGFEECFSRCLGTYMGAIRWRTRGMHPPTFSDSGDTIFHVPLHFLFRFHNVLVSHPPVSSHFTTKLGPWVHNIFVASRKLAQRDRWILTLYQKHFDLGKTCSATTDYVTWKATMDVWNRTDYVANDWHHLVDKLAIFIQRWCAFFVQPKLCFFTGAAHCNLMLYCNYLIPRTKFSCLCSCKCINYIVKKLIRFKCVTYFSLENI